MASSPDGYAAPAVPLAEYQRRWIEDASRYKIGIMSRQSGKSFGTSLEAVLDCYARKTMWVFLSAGERQSKQLMSEASKHARAIGLAVEELEDSFRDPGGDTIYKQLEIVFPNGSRIIGLPANPATARGFSANVLLDEFAFHQDSREIWKALFPILTRGYKIRVITTPQGRKNKAYELWTGPTSQIWRGLDYDRPGEPGGWSKHLVTIHDAVAMGLSLRAEAGNPAGPESLRLALGDDEAWAQEYLCEFLDEATAYLSYDLISTVEDVGLLASPSWVPELMGLATEYHDRHKSSATPPRFDASSALGGVPFSGDIYIGMDVARRRDLSVIWVMDSPEGRMRTRAVIELRGQPFGVQEAVLFSLLGLPQTRRACMDETGLGVQLAERALERYGSHKVEPVTFTAQGKEALASLLKRRIQDRRIAIPADQTLRNSLHSIKQIATATGALRYDAERSDRTGHADHFWALALALEAGSNPGGPVTHESAQKRMAKFGGGAW